MNSKELEDLGTETLRNLLEKGVSPDELMRIAIPMLELAVMQADDKEKARHNLNVLIRKLRERTGTLEQ